MSRGEGKEGLLVVEQRTAHESDAVAMVRFTKVNPHLVVVGREFSAKRVVRRKKEDEVGPDRQSRLSPTTTKTMWSSIVMNRY